MSEAEYIAKGAALDRAITAAIRNGVPVTADAIVKDAEVFHAFVGPYPVDDNYERRREVGMIMAGKTTAYVIVDGQNPSGAKMVFNGYAGGKPAWSSHMAQAIRFAREQDAAALIDTFEGHVCWVEEREFDAWAG